jgi:hypothetical protein
MTEWNKQSPALGEIIARLASISARLMRLEAARRLQVLVQIKQLSGKRRG